MKTQLQTGLHDNCNVLAGWRAESDTLTFFGVSGGHGLVGNDLHVQTGGGHVGTTGQLKRGFKIERYMGEMTETEACVYLPYQWPALQT